MSKNNPYDSSMDEYLEQYEGPYDPLFLNQKSPVVNKEITKKTSPQSVVTKTVDAVVNKTESVIEEMTGNETLSDKSHKKSLSFVDYAILFSSVYGIGAAVGITTGAGKNITPDSKKKPVLYWSMISLAIFGAVKGYKTVSNYKHLKNQLHQQTRLEKALEDRFKNR